MEWSDAEIEILELHYRGGGARQTQKALAVAGITRSFKAITLQAMKNEIQFWTTIRCRHCDGVMAVTSANHRKRYCSHKCWYASKLEQNRRYRSRRNRFKNLEIAS